MAGSSSSKGASPDPANPEGDREASVRPQPSSPRVDRRGTGSGTASTTSTGSRRPGLARNPSRVPMPPQWSGPFGSPSSQAKPLSPDASPVTSNQGDSFSPTGSATTSRVFPVRSQVAGAYGPQRRRSDAEAQVSPGISPPITTGSDLSSQGFSFGTQASSAPSIEPSTSSEKRTVTSTMTSPRVNQSPTQRQSFPAPEQRRQSGPESSLSGSNSERGEDLASVSDTDIIERARAARNRGPQETEPRNRDELYMTTRFEHQDTADGHMILIGRAGGLASCEDEPIHIPGAVQAFGVLIAIEENDDGDWKVVQCSENAGHVLGLPPRHLFSLRCFTQVFDEDNADTLRDQLDTVRERDDQDLVESGPLTCELEGQGVTGHGIDGPLSDMEWACWVTMHIPNRSQRPKLVILEFEIAGDTINPISTESAEPLTEEERTGLAGEPYQPTADDLYQSTTSMVKPLRSLARFRQSGKARGNGSMDIFRILGQVNEQLNRAADLHSFLKITVGVMRELTGFHRVMIYQFDETWCGQVVAELVDWTKTRDLYRGLHFPASDIPVQARELYKLNRVRSLYDRDQPTARMVCKNKEELDSPLDMTHCHLRAMSPIHIKYLANMGVRASASISIVAFGSLWGLISCHSYGRYGMRLSCPVRQMCRILGDSISRNIERLSYAQRLQSRKLINTAPTSSNPSGYIVAKAEDLLSLFDAEFGLLSVGDEAKLLGPVDNSQEALAVLEYLRSKSFGSIKVSQNITSDFPDIGYGPGFQEIAGLLSIPLSPNGKDFIVFFRRGQVKHIHWAGNPYDKILREGTRAQLEPRKSFKLWSETVLGKSKGWSDEQLETASVLCLVYGKFIDVWRQKQTALKSSQLTTLLLSNASHEVRTPLNAIVNYLEMALDGPLDDSTRDALSKSYNASRSLIHVINDLLDLTRTEEGNELAAQDPFELPSTIDEAIAVHRDHARERGLEFVVMENPTGTPTTVLGDRAKLRMVIANLVANAVRHTEKGKITVEWGEMQDPQAVVDVADELRQDRILICISIIDTGVGIPGSKLDSMFRDFEQVESSVSSEVEERARGGLGLGLAVVARIIRNLGGVLKADSVVGSGSRFSVVLPLRLSHDDTESIGSGRSATLAHGTSGSTIGSSQIGSSHGSYTATPIPGQGQGSPLRRRSSNNSADTGKGSNRSSQKSEIDSLVEAMTQSPRMGSAGSVPLSASSSMSHPHVTSPPQSARSTRSPGRPTLFSGAERSHRPEQGTGTVEIQDVGMPLRALRIDPEGNEVPATPSITMGSHNNFPFPTPPLTPGGASSVPASRRGSQDGSRRGSADSTFGPSSVRRGSRDLSSTSWSMDESKRREKAAETDSGDISLRVLVVEDDPINRAIIQRKLTKDGHKIDIAEHGEIALKKFVQVQRAYDVILMDLQMPICDGLTATKRIRGLEHDKPFDSNTLPPSHKLNGRVPILAVSASLPERQKEEIEEVGIDGWTLKPLNWSRVAKLLRGVTDPSQRDLYRPGQWESGGWLRAGSTGA